MANKILPLVIILLSAACMTMTISSMAQQGSSQQPAENLALTNAEQQEASTAATEKKQAEQAWLDSLKAALNAPASQAAEVQCAMKITFLQKEMAIARVESVLWKHRASRYCPDCAYSSDFKRLERPPAKKQAAP